MELKINVDETMFKQVIEKELKAFSSEELHEIIRECIVEALKTDAWMRRLFVEPKHFGYEPDAPSALMFEAAKHMDLSPAYEEVRDMMITVLKTDYNEILQKVFLRILVNGLCDGYGFRDRVEQVMKEILAERNH